MSRSGYGDYDDCEYNNSVDLWQQAVTRALLGKRGQAFLRELADALDALPAKRLVKNQFEVGGEVCALGAIARRRGVDMSDVDPEQEEGYWLSRIVGDRLGIARSMAAEIMWHNDEAWMPGDRNETPEQRYERMRRWVDEQIKEEKA